MPGATEFLCFTVGPVTISGFVTPQELSDIEAGKVVDVTLRHVTALHEDVMEPLEMGDMCCTFIGGEPSPFRPA